MDCRTPCLFRGYFRDDAETAEAFRNTRITGASLIASGLVPRTIVTRGCSVITIGELLKSYG